VGTIVELRCPNSARGLLARMKLEGERPAYVQPDNLIEFSCRDCARALRRDGDATVVRVYHRFDVVGTLIESEVERDPVRDEASVEPIQKAGVVAASVGRPDGVLGQKKG
jgi:hypothetical protein